MVKETTEQLLGRLAAEITELESQLSKKDGTWGFKSHYCKFHSDTVGDCDHKENKSSSMTSCNADDCPLRKIEHRKGW